MKKSLRTLTTTALALGTAAPVLAQYAPPPPLQPFPGFLNESLRKTDPYYANWDISGSARLRYEVRENALGLPPANDFRQFGVDNDNNFLGTKILARVGLTEKWWSVFVEGRSTIISGDSREPSPEQDAPIDLHQAYVTVGNHKEFPVSLKVGRQELSYGDERLVGAFGWNNIGRVFDAAKLRWQNSWFAAEAFTSKLVLPDDNNFNTWNDYNLFSGLHLSTKQIPKNLSELYFFARNDGIGSTTANPGAFPPFQVGAPAARDIYTIGARFRSGTNEFGNLDYTVEGAYQFGNWKPTTTSIRQGHEAYAFSANVGYSFPETWGTPRVALEYAYGSGDSSASDSTHETFDNLYPTNHKFYGYMDFASWQNLSNVRGIFQIRPHPRVSLALEGHLFMLADTADSFYNAGGVARGGQGPTAGNGYGRNPCYDPYVGSEIDFIAGFTLTKFASLEAGYGHFFVGDYVKQTWSNPAFGSADADWFYTSLNIKF